MHGSSAIRMLAAAAATSAALVAGCGRDEGGGGQAVPGVTETTIKLGGSYPFSGPASAYGVIGEASKAYFEYVNSKGGIHGRKIELVALDDGYEPARAVSNARRLIDQEQVFALFSTIGTANNLAIWDYVNEQRVPHAFVASPSSSFGEDVAAHPWTIGGQLDYVSEARVYGAFLKREKPKAKVAVLFQNDGFGEDLLAGFEEAIAGSGVEIVARESYEVTDPTVASQVRKLAGSGADTLLSAATPKFAAQAIDTVEKSGWKPLHVLANVSASEALVLEPAGLEASRGIVSAAYVKDAEDPRWADDEAMREYKQQIARYASRAEPNDLFTVFGWYIAQAMAEALEQAGPELTRERLMAVLRDLDTELPLLLPGVKLRTSEGDGYPIEAAQIQRFDGGSWRLEGEVIDVSRR